MWKNKEEILALSNELKFYMCKKFINYYILNNHIHFDIYLSHNNWSIMGYMMKRPYFYSLYDVSK